MSGHHSSEDFYDLIADQYDAMIEFDKRIEKEARILKPWIEQYGVKRAADMGCGTGVHTLALGSLGVETVGFDISGRMLYHARNRAADRENVSFERGDFLSPSLGLRGGFDLILCLGNSLPHAESRQELARILGYWISNLLPGGRIVAQLLNYERILKTRERIVNIRRIGETTIVRFYDFTEPRITFNVLTISAENDVIEHRMNSTLLLPITAEDVLRAAAEAGCGEVTLFSTLAREPFGENSKDLIAVIQKL
jgi:glycine/sarcosine N-methyltransferase